jgi:riboflavin biosynthesis pyrimidine reductase
MTWSERFAMFAARKQAEAVAARLSGYHTVDTPRHTHGLGQIGSPWTSALFDGPFFESPVPAQGLPAMNIVFVQSADGNTGARNPADLGGGATDTHLIYEGLSRVHADAVMTGASTIRDSQMILATWHPELVRLRGSLDLPPYPAQIVATRRGSLGIETALMFNIPELPVFILTTRDGAAALAARINARPWITVVVGPADEHLAGSLRQLCGEHGIRRISCIGGRTLATELRDAGLVQEIYLTTAPQPGGDPGTPFYTGEAALETRLVVRKTGRGDEAGVVFEHLLVTSSDRPTSRR